MFSDFVPGKGDLVPGKGEDIKGKSQSMFNVRTFIRDRDAMAGLHQYISQSPL